MVHVLWIGSDGFISENSACCRFCLWVSMFQFFLSNSVLNVSILFEEFGTETFMAGLRGLGSCLWCNLGQDQAC